MQWTVQETAAPDGAKLCLFSLSDGAIGMQFAMSVDDADVFAKGITGVTTKARSGIILPLGVVIPPANGAKG